MHQRLQPDEIMKQKSELVFRISWLLIAEPSATLYIPGTCLSIGLQIIILKGRRDATIVQKNIVHNRKKRTLRRDQ